MSFVAIITSVVSLLKYPFSEEKYIYVRYVYLKWQNIASAFYLKSIK